MTAPEQQQQRLLECLSGADLSDADLHKCDMRGIIDTTLTQRLDFAARGAINVDTETQ